MAMAGNCLLSICMLFCLRLFDVGRFARAENVTLCWGKGTNGELGNGQQDNDYNSSVPVQVLGAQSFAAVCAGGDHSCGLELTGAALCWGNNQFGQLGDGTTNSSATPVKVAGGDIFRSITCGETHTCALDDRGRALCWGYNDAGKLGIGSESDPAVPVGVVGGRTFTALCAGYDHTCGIDNLGQASCWGSNRYGQLGTGSSGVGEQEATPVNVTGGHVFRAISCGDFYTCALDDGGKAWCWGSARFDNALGTSAASDEQSTPVAVSGGHTFVSIAAGDAFTCALDTSGAMWWWGQLGRGTDGTTASNEPTEVTGGRTFKSISAGRQLACGLDTSGDVRCFGNNVYGTLGEGSLIDSFSPGKVVGGYPFLSLGPSRLDHMCAIATKGLDTGGSSPLSSPPLPSPTMPPSSPGTTPPSPAMPPPSPATPPPSPASASSAPIGAIAGGVAGAAAVLALLAFFALRPRKGWLRRRHQAQPLEEGGSGQDKRGQSARHNNEWHGSGAPSGSTLQPVPMAPAVWGRSPPAGTTRRSPADSMEGLDTLITYSCAPSNARSADWTQPVQPLEGGAPDWCSPLRTHPIAELGVASAPAAVVAGASRFAAVQPPPGPTSHTSSTFTPLTDSLLSLASSHLSSQSASQKPLSSVSQPLQTGKPTPSGGSSSSAELHAEARRWEVQWSELTILRLLGRGSFGSVYLAEWKQIPVAVKVLVGKEDMDRGLLQLPDRVMRDLQAEAAVMSHMRHPKVVHFMGLVAMPPALITEYCSRGSLYDCLTAAREQPAAAAQLTWRRRLAMAVDAGAGLLYLHSRSIIHRDVKSPNLLVDKDWNVKVADFNLSKLLEGARPEASQSSGGATNPIWLAPEILEGGKATAASDVYSFGLVLYELLTWRLPWTLANMTPFKLGAIIMQGERPEVPPRDQLPGPDTAGWACMDAYVQLMRDCWAQQPADRPSFDEVVGRLRKLLAETASA